MVAARTNTDRRLLVAATTLGAIRVSAAVALGAPQQAFYSHSKSGLSAAAAQSVFAPGWILGGATSRVFSVSQLEEYDRGRGVWRFGWDG